MIKINVSLDVDHFISSIKKIVNNIIINKKLCEYHLAIVTKIEPIEITLENQLVLKEESNHLLLTSNVLEQKGISKHEFNIQHTESTETIKYDMEITFNNNLSVGEYVLLSRIQGGNRYVVLDRLESFDVKQKKGLKNDNTIG